MDRPSILALFVAVVSFVGRVGAAPGAIVAELDGVPIYQEELELHEQRHRALVAVYFRKTHGVDLDEEARWNRSFGGEVPAQMLRERALESVLRDKKVQLEAQRQGVSNPLPFPGFREHLASVNETRRVSRERGNVIYGPPEFTAWQYYRYRIDQMRIALERERQPPENP